MPSSKQVGGSILILLGAALAAGSSDAQTTQTYWTLEARIAQADGVVLGTIAKISRKVIVAPGDKSPWTDGVVEYTVTVKIDEVLKGDTKESVDFVRTTSAFDKRLDEWLKAETPFLWLLARDKETVFVGGSIRLGEPVAAEAGYSSGIAPLMFSTDFAVLKGPAEILACARPYAKKSTRTLPIHTIPIPRVVADRCSPSGDANFLLLPVEASLEQTAKRLIASPQNFVPKETKLDSLSRDQLRVGGVSALRHFKSDANTALLRSLLDDPTEVLQTFDSGARKGTTVKQYPIRSKAYEILSDWGVPVPMPVIEVVVPTGAKQN
jgi:hypothetical protein